MAGLLPFSPAMSNVKSGTYVQYVRRLLAGLSLSMLVACQGGEDRSDSWLNPGATEGLIGGQTTLADDPGRNSVVMVLGPQKKGTAQGQADFSTCTGVLVAKNVVLTAAHCLKPVQDEADLYHDGIYADLGKIAFAADPTVAFRVSRILVHEEFEGQKWMQVKGGYMPRAPKDLALARFEGEAPAAAVIAKIPQLEIAKITAQKFHIYGYGLTSMLDDDRAERDREIAWGRDSFIRRTPLLGIHRDARFDTNFEYGFMIDQRETGGICFGDSGGPAFIQYGSETYLVAIHSHRTGIYKGLQGDKPVDEKASSDCHYFAVMTRTGGFAQWIQKGVNTLQETSCENEPLFRLRAAELFEIDEKGMKIVAHPNHGYRIEGAHIGSDRKLAFDVRSDAGCRIPSHQGYLRRAEATDTNASLPIRNVLSAVRGIVNLEVNHLRDRIPMGLTLIPQTLILNLTGLYGWHPPEDGWIFQSIIRNAEGTLVAIPSRAARGRTSTEGGSPIMQALEIDSPELNQAITQAISRDLRVFWLAYSLPGQGGYNQEIWIRDPVRHELVILRQSVRL